MSIPNDKKEGEDGTREEIENAKGTWMGRFNLIREMRKKGK